MLLERLGVAALHLDPANVRRHPERNLDAIKASLARFGQQRPILVDADGIVRAGNGTLMAARALGWAEIDCVRTELRGAEATAYAIADNRTAELAEWEDGLLAEQLDALRVDGVDLGAIGFSDRELDALMRQVAREAATTSQDEAPGENKLDELAAKWATAAGQLWVIPSAKDRALTHRLLCGDSTKAEDVTRLLGGAVPFLMVTDPPYGVEYDPSWRKEVDPRWDYREGQVANDDRCDWTAAYQLFPGDVAYVWHAGIYAGDVVLNLAAADLMPRAQIIWDKQSLVMGRGAYHWKHEPCWYTVRKGRTARWAGDRKQSTVWEIAGVHRTQGTSDDGITEHGTQKPVECMARPIRNHGEPGDLVYDPFLGSGTTIVAAEQLGRACLGIELKPTYTALILERLTNLGLQPRLDVGA
jgi:DNA modification methylase